MEKVDKLEIEEIIKQLKEERRKVQQEYIQKIGYEPIVELDTNVKIMLNPILLFKQGVDENKFKKLAEAHKNKHKILEKMKITDEKSTLKFLAETITQIEFSLQRLWGFPEDINYHRFWELPKCTCPKLDNEDAYPTGYYVRVQSCPLHGFNNQSNNNKE